MKNIYTLVIVSTFLVVCSNAQITVQMSEVQSIFTPGEFTKVYTPSLTSINVGQKGGPNVYDFSTLPFADTSSMNMTKVSDVPELLARYPSTAFMWGSPLQTSLSNPAPISEFLNNEMLIHGSASISTDTLRFIHRVPPEEGIHFPLVYDASWNYSLTRTDTTYIFGVATNIQGGYISKSIFVDGYGTLKIAGRILQCLRLKRTLTSPSPSDNEYWYITREGSMFMVLALANQPDTGIVQIEMAVLLVGQSLDGVHNERNFPTGFSLNQNFPNPFNPTTTIQYSLSRMSPVNLTVYDMLGREIATLVSDVQPAGLQSIEFNASGLSSGVYLYRIKVREFSETKKLVLLR